MKLRICLFLVIFGATDCGPEKEPLTCRPWGKDAPDRIRREIDAVASSDAALQSYRKFWEDYSSRFAGPFPTETGRYDWDGERWVRVSESNLTSNIQFIIDGVGILIVGRDNFFNHNLWVETQKFRFFLVYDRFSLYKWVFNLSGAWEWYSSNEYFGIQVRELTPISYFSRHTDLNRSYRVDFDNFHLLLAIGEGQVGGSNRTLIEFNGRKTSMSNEEARRECPGIEDEIRGMLPNPNDFVDVTVPQEVLRFFNEKLSFSSTASHSF